MHRISDILPVERPRERLRSHGAEALKSEELLAVLLGTGTKKESVLELSHHIIKKFKGIKGLSEATLEELQEIPGIGLAKGLMLRAAFALASRSQVHTQEEQQVIKTPNDAFKVALPFIKNEKREFFLSILLDVRYRLIGVEMISVGTLTETLIHPREVFFPAIRRKAHAMIIVHNHPSGHLEPSFADRQVTEQLNDASSLVKIPILDHLIIGNNGYYSFKEDGFVFAKCGV